jgi:hypothetical protein
MGGNLTAFAAREAAQRVREERGGELLEWAGVRALVARDTPAAPRGGGAHE